MKKEKGLEDIKKQLEECQKKKEEYLAGWQRAKADYLNYKKGEIERVTALIGFATGDLVLKLLPILDNFDLVEKNLPEDMNDDEYIKGVNQIKVQIEDILKSFGVEEIKAAGERFDPNFHEAVEQVESEGKESGNIVEEVQKGYKVQDRVIRPAKVKVIK